MNKNKWTDINDESPDYYKLVDVMIINGTIINKVWKASDGDNDIWSIFTTNNIIEPEKIHKWKYSSETTINQKDYKNKK